MSGSLPFSYALITGGGGGIGEALASYLITTHKVKVLLAGRTESTFSASAREIGAAGYHVLDRPLDIQLEAPADFFDKADNGININVKGPLHLTIGLLPHLRVHAAAKAKARCADSSASNAASTATGAAVVNVSSVLGFVPFSIDNPIYSSAKAWLHFWSMNLRTQLRGTGVAVVEIAPLTVATDLHRERADPNDKDPGALSVGEFVDEVGRRLVAGEDTIGAGMSTEVVERWYGGVNWSSRACDLKSK